MLFDDRRGRLVVGGGGENDCRLIVGGRGRLWVCGGGIEGKQGEVIAGGAL